MLMLQFLRFSNISKKYSTNFKEIVVTKSERLDKILCKELNISRNLASSMVNSNQITILPENQIKWKVKNGIILPVGSKVVVNQISLQECSDPISVLAYQSDNWIIVDKPALKHVHPKLISENQTILNSVYQKYPTILGVGTEGLTRSGVVHRLDFETSGVLIMALSQVFWDTLRSAFEDRKIKKIYHAIVYGIPEVGESWLNIGLKVARHRPSRVIVDSTGYPSKMRIKILKTFPSSCCSLIEVNLESGFLHQIRVSLHHLGHPVLGDKVYFTTESNMKSTQLGVPRQMLHAYRMTCKQYNIDTTSRYHQDFEELLSKVDQRCENE